ncbi:MAG: hypothetical protein N3E51_03800 [Candidatus Micrarchaeota archaeon]|nr:hypothetical protein [Candidatus Micrarchaeota archaeon]
MLAQKTEPPKIPQNKPKKPNRFRRLIPLAFSAVIALGCSGSGEYSDYRAPNPTVRLVNEKMLDLPSGLAEICRRAADKDCLLFGETHSNQRMNYIVSKMLPDLKKAGFKYMVMEIDTAYQRFIDHYLSNDSLTKDYLYSTIPVFRYYPKDAELAEACRKNGISILLADNHYEEKRWSDTEMFNYIISKIPPSAKFIVDFGSYHTRYSKTEPTLGSLLKAKFQDGCYSICIQNLGEDAFVGLEKEGYLDAKAFDARTVVWSLHSENLAVRAQDFDAYLFLRKR